MKKVKVEICVGTWSYVMGGAQLMNLQEELPEDLSDKVEIKGVLEFPELKEEKGKKPPFASVDGKFMQEASIESIITQIRENLT